MARRSKENAIGWDLVERQYRLGKKSNTQLSAEFGVSVSSIGRRATRYGWVVDKSEQVDAVTNSLLIQSASGKANPNATPTQLEIKAAGHVAADVVLGHRVGLRRISCLRDKLLDEISEVTDNLGLFRKLGEMLDQSGEDESGRVIRDRLNEAYRGVISTSGRIDDLKKLAEIDERVRKGEREAFGIDNKERGDGAFEEVLRNVIAEQGR